MVQWVINGPERECYTPVPYLRAMRTPNIRQLVYEGQTYYLDGEELGGSPEQAALRGSDELLLDWVKEQRSELAPKQPEELAVNIFEDPAAVLTLLVPGSRRSLSTDCRTPIALQQLWQHNQLAAALPPCHSVLEPWEAAPINIMRLPKSLDLFELLLTLISARAGAETRLAVCFMTRHFSPRMLSIAQRFATQVEQSRAYKKARLLTMSGFKSLSAPAFLRSAGRLPQVEPSQLNFSTLEEAGCYHQLSYQGVDYRQLYGVFSGNHIDYGSKFLLDSWDTVAELATLPAPNRMLDIGCGNGVIGHQLLLRYPEAALEAFDTSLLAVASARQNFDRLLPEAKWAIFAAAAIPSDGAPFDLIVTNPPFHDGHRNTIDPSLELFRQAAGKLTSDGSLVIVANRHLNYATHLRKLFEGVAEVATNKKYVLYRCQLSRESLTQR